MFFIRVAVIVGVLAGVGAQETRANDAACLDETPLPSPLQITVPSADVAKEIAQFAGVWGGAKWGGNLCHTLVVSAVDAAGNAEVIYSFGKYLPWNIKQADFFMPSGKIEGGVLRLTGFGNGAEVKYYFSDGKMHGEYLLDGGTTPITLNKIER